MRNIMCSTFEQGGTPSIQAGVYHNPSLGLISLSDDGIDWITIADKNLGATVVYNEGDTRSESNCGGFFQWGNNYMFPWTGSVTTDSNQVDTTGYGPGNYYSSSTFIIGNNDWSSVQNDDLWGDTTDTLAARQGPCDSGYHISTEDENVALVDTLTALGIDTSNGNCMKTYLKMPFAGNRSHSSSDLNSRGVFGYYWSSTADFASLPDNAVRLNFYSTKLFPHSGFYRSEGYSIRPFKNTPVQPDSSRTVLYQPVLP